MKYYKRSNLSYSHRDTFSLCKDYIFYNSKEMLTHYLKLSQNGFIPKIEPTSPVSPELAAVFFTTEPPVKTSSVLNHLFLINDKKYSCVLEKWSRIEIHV